MDHQEKLTDEERKAGLRAVERMEKVARKWTTTRWLMISVMLMHGIGGIGLFIFGAMAVEKAKARFVIRVIHDTTFERRVEREISDIWDMFMFQQSMGVAYLPLLVGTLWIGIAIVMGVLLYHRWDYGIEMALRAKLMRRQIETYDHVADRQIS